jgi:CBS domain-containing protein
MQQITVKDLMVPISHYATVFEDATLYEAIVALEDTQSSSTQKGYKHRAVLVLDHDHKIAGKINLWDVIEGLEPKYKDLRQPREPSSRSFGPEYVKSMCKTYDLWREPLEEICSKVSQISVKDVMRVPSDAEYISQEAELGEAINQLIIGHYLSLLVTGGGKVVGILRLIDVFQKIYELAKACRS